MRGIQPNDVDIISTLESTLVKEIYEDQELDNLSGQVGLEDFLSSQKLQIIAHILINLQELGKSDFLADCTEDDLFPNILINKYMLTSFTKHDLDVIASRVETFPVQNIFTTKDNKVMRKAIAQNVKSFPLIVLQCVYAAIVHVKNKQLWKQFSHHRN